MVTENKHDPLQGRIVQQKQHASINTHDQLWDQDNDIQLGYSQEKYKIWSGIPTYGQCKVEVKENICSKKHEVLYNQVTYKKAFHKVKSDQEQG
jgi:hypothetical protein